MLAKTLVTTKSEKRWVQWVRWVQPAKLLDLYLPRGGYGGWVRMGTEGGILEALYPYPPVTTFFSVSPKVCFFSERALN